MKKFEPEKFVKEISKIMILMFWALVAVAAEKANRGVGFVAGGALVSLAGWEAWMIYVSLAEKKTRRPRKPKVSWLENNPLNKPKEETKPINDEPVYDPDK